MTPCCRGRGVPSMQWLSDRWCDLMITVSLSNTDIVTRELLWQFEHAIMNPVPQMNVLVV